MFHHWAPSERGWGYFPYPYTFDTTGTVLFVDSQLNLLVLVVTSDPQFERFGNPRPTASPSHALFFSGRPHEVKVDAVCNSLILVVPGRQLGQLPLPAGSAERIADEVFEANPANLLCHILNSVPSDTVAEMRRLLTSHGFSVPEGP